MNDIELQRLERCKKCSKSVEDTPKGFIPIKASEFYKVMEQED